MPLVVGAPQLKRYTAFGHLFAGYQGRTFRIDRHPVMSRHPVTPMDESDLLLPSVRADRTPSWDWSTSRRCGRAGAGEAIDRFRATAPRSFCSTWPSPETQAAAGGALWRMRKSASFRRRLVRRRIRAHRRMDGFRIGAGEGGLLPAPGAVDRLAVVSGSVSPTTERQIGHALANGFDGIAVDPLELVSERAEQSSTTAIAVAGSQPCCRAQRHPLHRAWAAGRSRRRDRQPGGRAPQARPRPRRHPARVW